MNRSYETIGVEDKGEGLVLLTLNRPQVANALNTQMGRDLLAFFEVNLGNLPIDPRLDDDGGHRLDGANCVDFDRRRHLHGGVGHDRLGNGRPCCSGVRGRLEEIPPKIISAGENNCEERSQQESFHPTSPIKLCRLNK